MNTAIGLFEEAITWLRQYYDDYTFYCERDLVWTVQSRVRTMVSAGHLPYRAFNDFPMIPGPRRSLSADLALISEVGFVDLAVEFKYEPAHHRADIWPTKFPVVSWGDEGVAKDVERVKQYVAIGKARAAYSIFIDEGRYFRHRPPHPGSAWIDWEPVTAGGRRVSVLLSRVGVDL